VSREKQLELEKEMLSLGEEKYRNELSVSDDFDSVHIQKIVTKMIIPFSQVIKKAIDKDIALNGNGTMPPLKRLNNKHFFVNALSKKEIELGSERDTTVTCMQLSFLVVRGIFISLREGKRTESSCNRELGKQINSNVITEEKYPDVDELRIGATLNDLLVNAYPEWFDLVWDKKHKIYKNPFDFIDSKSKKREYIITPSEKFMDFCSEIIEGIAEISAIIHPMIYIPDDWSEDGRGGGFYSEQLKRNIIKKKDIHYPSGINVDIAAAVNSIQSTPWKVNHQVLYVLDMLNIMEKPSTLPKIFPETVEETPKKPWESIDKENHTEEQVMDVRKWWRKAAKLTKARQAKRSLDLSTNSVIFQAKKFQNELFLYFPHDLDYRDRIYNKCMTGLNTQGSDVQKGVLQFAHGEVLTAGGVRWMKINMANLVGHDKLKLVERVAWVDDNEILLRTVATDPIGCNIWHTWDKPIQGLASALEYIKWLDNPLEPVFLHVQLDGLCNGVQHLSAITRDAAVAPHVGLIPTEQRGDVYQFVCDAVIEVIKSDTDGWAAMSNEWIESELLDRGLTKTPVMTRSYGAKLYGIKEGIQDYIDEKNKEDCFSDVFSSGNWMGERIWDGMSESLAGPMAFMEWVQKCAGVLAKHNLPMNWVNPIGGKCSQSPFKTTSKTLKVKINGRRVDYKIHTPTDKIDKGKAEASSSPNLIHGNDASHLLLTVIKCLSEGINKFAMVHDSFGCHPNYADKLLLCAKEAWIEIYSKDWMHIWYVGWCEQMQRSGFDVDLLPLPPEKGTLDITNVMGSDFFFV
jgi:DNA-directed RNA polymerase